GPSTPWRSPSPCFSHSKLPSSLLVCTANSAPFRWRMLLNHLTRGPPRLAGRACQGPLPSLPRHFDDIEKAGLEGPAWPCRATGARPAEARSACRDITRGLRDFRRAPASRIQSALYPTRPGRSVVAGEMHTALGLL